MPAANDMLASRVISGAITVTDNFSNETAYNRAVMI
jgi:hypothetical protein